MNNCSRNRLFFAAHIGRGMVLLGLLFAGCSPQQADDVQRTRERDDDLLPLPRAEQAVRPSSPSPSPVKVETEAPPELEPPPEDEPFPAEEELGDLEERIPLPAADNLEADEQLPQPSPPVAATPPPLPLPEGVQRAHTRFMQSLERLTEERQEALGQLNQLYVQRLADLGASLQAQGNLEGVIAVRAEHDRFEREQAVRTSDRVEQPAELANLQERYRASQYSDVFLENAQAATRLLDRYTEGLERMVTELVREGNIEDAQAVRQEIDRVNALEARQEIKRVLEGVATTRGGEDKSTPTPPATAAVPWGDGVYRLGDEPPGDFSESLVRHTRLSRAGAHRARLTFMMREDAHLTRNERSRHTRAREGEIGHHPRVIIRPSQRESFVGCTFVFQYYAHALAERDRFVLMRTEHIPLPNVSDGQEFVVDGAGVRYYIDEYHYHPSRYNRLRGHEHSGLIFSVYDADGNLLVQGTDSLSLEDEASPRLPPPLNDERGTLYRQSRW